MQKYFRVLQYNTDNEQSYDTSISCYGDGFDTAPYRHFMEVYGNTMAQVNLPADFLISVSNQIYMNGEVYLNLLNNSIDDNGLLHLFKVTNNQNHKGFTIHIDLISDFLQSFDENNQFIFFDNGTVLWEYYLEKVRSEEFNYLPARLKSVFFFQDINNSTEYNKIHLNGMGSTYSVEIMEEKSMFEGDMRIIDEFNNSISRDPLIEQVRKYWRGEKTENPVMEIVFQGKYNLIKLN